MIRVIRVASMSDIYREKVLDHYKHPRNYGKIKNPDFSHEEQNIFCGDSVEIYGLLDKDIIPHIKFTGRGCVISQAAASLLLETLQGKSIKEIERLTIKDVVQLLGVSLSSTRMKCAELPLLALKKGLGILK